MKNEMENVNCGLHRGFWSHMKVDDFEAARKSMVEDQLKPHGIRDPRVLAAMGAVPRERFLPPNRQGQAYYDGALSIACGQTISQPYMVALMTQELRLSGSERVLEIGTGSGYQGAILAELAERVYTVERIEELSVPAQKILRDELGYENLSFRTADGTLGWPEEAPFDRIMVTAGAPKTPAVLLEQLGRGGRAVVPIGPEYVQSLTVFSRDEEGQLTSEEVCQCVFVKLIGEDGW